MKILWFLNSPIGINGEYLNNIKSQSGTWINCSYENLSNNFTSEDILYIASYNSPNKKIKINNNLFIIGIGEKAYIGKINHHFFYTEKLINEIKPDIIQIWGTEFTFGLNILNIAKKKNIPVIFYIQGVMNAISKFTYGDLNLYNLFIHSGILALPKIIKLYRDKKHYHFQKKYEKEMLSKSFGYICDNDWVINYFNYYNTNNYFDINKINKNFLNKNWKINNNNTLITIAGTKPEKGIHQLLKAIVEVKKVFPCVKLLIPGDMRFGLKENPFVTYIKNYIKRYNLTDNVVFLGKLNSEKMSEELLSADIFINPSYIENISTSLREAMYLGMPCISSMVGSIPEYMHHGYNGLLYRYEEIPVLASEIIELLTNKEKAINLGINAYKSIREKYPQDINDSTLYNIYKKVISVHRGKNE